MIAIAGVLRCPDCAAPVTAWQGHRLPLFDLDPYDPYQIHRCNPLAYATLRQARAMERLADVTEERNTLRAAMPMPVRRLAVGPTKMPVDERPLSEILDV